MNFMTDDKIFIDSNVLVYLVDKDISKKEIVISLTTTKCLISTQVVAENMNVCLKKLNLPYSESVKHANKLLDKYIIKLIHPSTFKIAFHVLEKYKFSFWDSMIIASALENDCGILYSEDLQHNQLIEGKLRIINPFSEKAVS